MAVRLLKSKAWMAASSAAMTERVHRSKTKTAVMNAQFFRMLQ